MGNRVTNQQTDYSTRVVILVDASLSMSQTLSQPMIQLHWNGQKRNLMERLKKDQGQRQFELGVFGATVEDVFPDWQD